jgi:hypothetical protein
MGGVDIANQRRSYYFTQLRVCRNWLPLFFWLLDTTIINAFLVSQQFHSEFPHLFMDRKANFWSTHGFFRTRLAWSLVLEGFRQINHLFAAEIHKGSTSGPLVISDTVLMNDQRAIPLSAVVLEAMWGKTSN